jgi:hypothetical protein
MKPAVIIFLIFQFVILFGQTTDKKEEDPRIVIVQESLNHSSTSGKLNKIVHRYNFKGTLEYQLSWKKGGHLLYCRNVFSDSKDHVFLSRFQKQLMKEKARVKINKEEQLKFTHTFKF